MVLKGNLKVWVKHFLPNMKRSDKRESESKVVCKDILICATDSEETQLHTHCS